jgi:hypothetical protein
VRFCGRVCGSANFLFEHDFFGKPVSTFPDHALVLNAVAMQIVAVGIEPGLGALDMTADFRDYPPEPRRMIHLDEMRHFMGGEVIQHEGRRQNQPP